MSTLFVAECLVPPTDFSGFCVSLTVDNLCSMGATLQSTWQRPALFHSGTAMYGRPAPQTATNMTAFVVLNAKRNRVPGTQDPGLTTDWSSAKPTWRDSQAA